MRSASLPTRLSSLLASAGLITAGLVVTGVGTSAAAVPPVIGPTAQTVTSDALPTTQIDGVAWTQVIAGNTVFVGGKFATARPAGAAPGTQLVPRANLLSYDLSTGVLNAKFNPTLNAQAKALAVSPDGTRLYVGGSFTKVGSVTKNRIAAFDTATGALISTFTAGVDYTVNAIEATNSAVYVGGAFNSANGNARTRLAAFHPTSGALLAWNPSADAAVNALAMTPDRSAVIVGGAFQNVNASPAYGLAKVNATTAALLPWNATKTVRNAGSSAAILSLVSDGDAIYGSGYAFSQAGNLEGVFSADPATGDIRWIEDCHGDTYDAWAGNGVVYSVSHAHYCGNVGGFPQSDPWSVNTRHALAFTAKATGTVGADPHGYWNFAGAPAPSLINWFPDMDAGTYTGKAQAAWSVTGNSRYVILGGEFPTVNGVAQQGLVRFALPSIAPRKIGPTHAGAKFNPGVVALPSGAGRISWQANSDRDDRTLTYRLTRDGAQVYTADADSSFWDRPPMGYLDTSVQPGRTYKYRLSATDKDGNVAQSDIISFTAPAAGSMSALAQRVIADGAAPYWPMNEASGTTLLDNAGFTDGDATAPLIRSVQPGAVAGDTASSFDGTATASSRTAISGPDTFTAQAWINTTTTNGGKILGFGRSRTGNSTNYDRHIYMDGAGRIFFGVHPGFVATLNSGTGYNDGRWHQITASLGAGGMTLSIDGKEIARRTDVTSGEPFAGHWRVGGDNLAGWPNVAGTNFAGAVDEIAIYPTVLSRQQIDAQWVASGRPAASPAAPGDPYGAAVHTDGPLLYWRLGETAGATTAVDSGPGGDQTGLIQNGVTLGAAGGVKGTANTSAQFDGSNDFVASTKSFTNPTTYSAEAWFKTTSTSGGKIIGFGSSQTGTSGSHDRHVYMNNDGKLTFGTWTGTANTITTPTALNDGVWHHVVASQSSPDGMKLYIDGALVGTHPQTGAQGYSGYWRVGGDNHWGCCSAFLNATIDDVAVYSSALTAAQVANHFTLGNTVAAPNKAPVAGFSSTATFLNAAFTSTSTDADGTVATHEWNFGDNTAGSTEANPKHTYAAAGAYSVTLKVTDDRGATHTVTRTVTVAAAPANKAPVASFTATAAQLTANVDATGSSDPDGRITSYAWRFGDGGTATGVTTSHTFATAGTRQVTLTVTDDKGATATVTRSVTVTSPPPPPPGAVVTDTFGRTSAGGWGSADTGGAWSVAGGSANFTVGGGAGRIRLSAPGAGPSATLGASAAVDTALSVDVALDKAPTGGGVYVSAAGRKVGTSEYRTTAKFLAGGAVQLQLIRIVNGGSTTLGAATVSGLTYTAGSTVTLRFEITGSAGAVTVRAKAWNTGGAEPANWTASVSDTSASRLTAAGGVSLQPYLSGSSTNAPVTASFDNLRVTAIQP